MVSLAFAATHVLERKHAMLVLRRKVGESVVIGGNIQVVVLAVEGDRVKIGFQAPLGVNIVREELLSSAGSNGAKITHEKNLLSGVTEPRH